MKHFIQTVIFTTTLSFTYGSAIEVHLHSTTDSSVTNMTQKSVYDTPTSDVSSKYSFAHLARKMTLGYWKNRYHVKNLSKALVTDDMSSDSRNVIKQILKSMNKFDRQVFFEQIGALTILKDNIYGNDRTKIIEKFSKLNYKKRKFFLEEIQSLIPETMEERDQIYMVLALTNVDQYHQKDFIQFCINNQITSQHMIEISEKPTEEWPATWKQLKRISSVLNWY